MEEGKEDFEGQIEALLANLVMPPYVDKEEETPKVRKKLYELQQNTSEKVNFQYCYIGDAGAFLVSALLEKNTTCTYLEFYGNTISGDGCVALATALQANNTLTYLDLQHNDISDDGCVALGTFLQVNNTLTHLDINRNNILDPGCVALATSLQVNNTLSYLNLQNNKISDDGCVALATSLQVNNILTFLDIGYNRISDVGCVTLAASLQVNNTLTELSLGYNNMSDIGCVALATALQVNNILTDLNLRANNIADPGCEAVATSLQINNTLTKLDLGFNAITNVGCEALAASLKMNSTLNTLGLDKNKIRKTGILSLANAIKTTDRTLILDVREQEYDGVTTDDTEVESDYLSCVSQMGKGHFGSAYLGHIAGDSDDSEGEDVVIKSAHTIESVESLYETLVLSCLPKHKNLVKLHGICDDFKDIGGDGEILPKIYTDDESDNDEARPDGPHRTKRQVLVLSLYKGGSLKNFIHENHIHKMKLSKQLSYLKQMTAAIEHLHNHNMVHRDIALRNYVLSEDCQTVVLIDFGLSFMVEGDDKPFFARENDALPFRCLPPESLFKPQPYYKASDVWMLGIAFWELYSIAIQTPFKQKTSIIEFRKYLLDQMVTHRNPIPLTFPIAAPQQIKDLTFRCCNFDHKQRPTATEVLQMIDDLIINALDFEVEANADGEDIEGENDVSVDDDAPVLYSEFEQDEEKEVVQDYSSYYRDYEKEDGPSDYYNFTKEIEKDPDFDIILEKYRIRTGTALNLDDVVETDNGENEEAGELWVSWVGGNENTEGDLEMKVSLELQDIKSDQSGGENVHMGPYESIDDVGKVNVAGVANEDDDLHTPLLLEDFGGGKSRCCCVIS